MNRYVKKLALMIPPVKKHYRHVEELRAQVNAYEMETGQLRRRISDHERYGEELFYHFEQLRSQMGMRYRDCSHYETDMEQLRSQVESYTGLKYYSCQLIERFYLYLTGHIEKPVGTDKKLIRFCDEPISNIPSFALSGTAEEIMKSLAIRRAEIIAESMKFSILDKQPEDKERRYTSACAKCARYQQHDWTSDNLIHFIDLGMYPAPCQSRCIYCGVHCSDMSAFNEQLHSESYEKVFDLIDYIQGNNMIAKDAKWKVACSEISIHPYKDRILDLVKDKDVTILTNCFVFDEKIAAILSANPRSTIYLSIDSGTPETWHKVKGVNNFDTITGNLARYLASSIQPGQITLKYIILPGINDNSDDYRSIVEIMKSLRVNHLTISRDHAYKYSSDTEHHNTMIRAAGSLVALLQKNGMTMQSQSCFPNETEEIMAFANELTESDKG